MERNTIKLEVSAQSSKRGMLYEFSLPMLLSNAALFLVGLLLGSYSPFEGVAPFGAALIMAAWFSALNPYFACAGAILGHVLSGGFIYAGAALLMGFAIFLISSRVSLLRVYRILVLFPVECVSLVVFGAFFGSRAVTLIGASTVSVFAAVVMGGALKALEAVIGGRELSDTELLTLSAFFGLITLSMQSFNVSGQSPAVVFAGLCALFAAYRFGAASAAVAVTVGAGRILASGGELRFIAVISAAALLGSSLRGLGKWACLAGFAGTSLLLSSALGSTGVFSWFEVLSCSLIFALVPVRLYSPSKRRGEIASPARPDPKYSRLQYDIASLSEVLFELSRVWEGLDGRMLGCIASTLKNSLSGRRRPAAFTALYGSASSVKRGSLRSGDSISVFTADNKLLLALSDGMGSGDEAGRESRAALDLMKDLLSVGFDTPGAAECVNSLLTRRGGGDMYATLDLTVVDLSDGTARLLKHGAPPTYILRNGKLTALDSEALPIGIIENTRSEAEEIGLRSGDTVIMMTDGVTDALGSALSEAIRSNVLGYGDVEMAAHSLLDEALKRGGNDDMTVLLARLEEKAC